MALFAAVLLYIGGFEALQQASVLAGVPFTIVMLLMCWSLYKSIREDARKEGLQEEPQEEHEPEDRAARKPAGEPASSPGK